MLTHSDFLLLATIPALNFAAFFLYIAAAPAFLIGLLGVTTTGFAWLFVPMISGVMIGAFISGRLAGRSPQRTIRLGYTIAFSGVAPNLLICTLLPPAPIWNVLPIMLFTIGSSTIMPSVALLLLDVFPTMRGLASSLQGFVEFALAAFNAGTIAPLLANSLVTLASGMAAFAIGGFVCWLIYQHSARIPLKGWTP